ncbi:hypothetical protein ACRAWC_25100 [Leifsonia sp. L25]|uniref:hypothetical protein n=1 Tax=Leifsonia TaxID=110932 RepID=UPI003D67F5E2
MNPERWPRSAATPALVAVLATSEVALSACSALVNQQLSTEGNSANQRKVAVQLEVLE